MFLHLLVHRKLNICHFLLRMSANFKTVWWFFTSLGKPKFDIISFLPEHFTWGLMPYLSTVIGLMWFCKLAQQHIITVVYSLRKGVGWIICYKSVWIMQVSKIEIVDGVRWILQSCFPLAFYLPRFCINPIWDCAYYLVLQAVFQSYS